jgi:hypothetical protein
LCPRSPSLLLRWAFFCLALKLYTYVLCDAVCRLSGDGNNRVYVHNLPFEVSWQDLKVMMID